MAAAASADLKEGGVRIKMPLDRFDLIRRLRRWGESGSDLIRSYGSSYADRIELAVLLACRVAKERQVLLGLILFSYLGSGSRIAVSWRYRKSCWS
jgi:hypothetical protein